MFTDCPLWFSWNLYLYVSRWAGPKVSRGSFEGRARCSDCYTWSADWSSSQYTKLWADSHRNLDPGRGWQVTIDTWTKQNENSAGTHLYRCVCSQDVGWVFWGANERDHQIVFLQPTDHVVLCHNDRWGMLASCYFQGLYVLRILLIINWLNGSLVK